MHIPISPGLTGSLLAVVFSPVEWLLSGAVVCIDCGYRRCLDLCLPVVILEPKGGVYIYLLLNRLKIDLDRLLRMGTCLYSK